MLGIDSLRDGSAHDLYQKLVKMENDDLVRQIVAD
jgi:hypothetical protein